ncbi:2TM domain-containing protein [Veronia nyctiphanis]|nr:2TM domain-containing protein [Veronia nyctiphanis]
MNEETELTADEQNVLEQIREIKAFYSYLLNYGLVIALLFLINFIAMPDYIWAIWPALGWGIYVAWHGLNAFDVVNFFGPEWEKKQLEKRLGRKL